MSQTIEQAIDKIKGAIRANGPFSHNIASLVLMDVSENHGVEQANKIIRDLNLTKLYGIYPVDELEFKTRPVKTAENPNPKVVPLKVEVPKETPYERSRKKANEVLRRLYVELGQVSIATEEPVVYELVDNPQESKAVEIKIQALPESHPSYNKKVRVYADLRGNGYYHHTDYKIYIRIDTDDWSLNFKKNWTPETKDLAKKINAKVVEFVKRLKSDHEQRVRERNVENESKEFLAAKFPGDTVYGNRRGGTVYAKTGKVEYLHESRTFAVELRSLTEDQLDRILKIAAENRGE